MTVDRPRAAISWSGGKDSCAALRRARSSYDVVAMVTMFDEDASRSRSHGLRPEVLEAQATRLGLRPAIGRCSWDSYDRTFAATLDALLPDGITHIVFGDILFEEHRRWAEQICEPHGLIAVEPLWGSSTEDLFEEWINSGDEAMIVTTRAALLDETWLGRPLTRALLPEFDRLGVDRCGERGEYHTVVTGSSLFSAPLKLTSVDRVRRGDCWALDVRVDHADGA